MSLDQAITRLQQDLGLTSSLKEFCTLRICTHLMSIRRILWYIREMPTLEDMIIGRSDRD